MTDTTTQADEREALIERLRAIKKNERHLNYAETRYWFDQYRQLAEDLVAELSRLTRKKSAHDDERPLRLLAESAAIFLEAIYGDNYPPARVMRELIAAIQPGQEPVAKIASDDLALLAAGSDATAFSPHFKAPELVPLYAAPPADTARQDRIDAERYRTLRQQCVPGVRFHSLLPRISCDFRRDTSYATGEALDAAVDLCIEREVRKG